MLSALMNFVQYGSQENFQILEDLTPPNSEPSSPILSASPGLFFSRFRSRRSDEDDEDIVTPFSPCSFSTPEKSSPLNDRLEDDWPSRRLDFDNEIKESNEQPASSALPTRKPLKRKGLSVIDDNVSPTASKRFRFEEHAVDYEAIDENDQKSRKEHKRIKKTLDTIDYELDVSQCRLIALLSTSSWRVSSDLKEVLKRRRALRSYNRVLQRKLEDSKAKKMSR